MRSLRRSDTVESTLIPVFRGLSLGAGFQLLYNRSMTTPFFCIFLAFLLNMVSKGPVALAMARQGGRLRQQTPTRPTGRSRGMGTSGGCRPPQRLRGVSGVRRRGDRRGAGRRRSGLDRAIGRGVCRRTGALPASLHRRISIFSGRRSGASVSSPPRVSFCSRCSADHCRGAARSCRASPRSHGSRAVSIPAQR